MHVGIFNQLLQPKSCISCTESLGGDQTDKPVQSYHGVSNHPTFRGVIGNMICRLLPIFTPLAAPVWFLSSSSVISLLMPRKWTSVLYMYISVAILQKCDSGDR